jgi:hypothetical protein
LGDGLLQVAGLGVEGFEFFVPGAELGLEVLITDGLARGDADVAAGVEAPALGFDLGERGGLAEAGDVAVGKERGYLAPCFPG